MDTKKIYLGGEPRISNPDLMLMQYSNRAGIQSLAKVFGNCIVSGCECSIDLISYSIPRNYTIKIEAGYAIIDGELIKVDSQLVSGVLSNNVPVSNQFSYYLRLNKLTTYDPNGDKVFNDNTPRQTWEINRGILTLANNYNNSDDDSYLHIGTFSGNYSISNASINMYDENPIDVKAKVDAAALIATNNANKFGNLSFNKSVVTDSNGKLVSSTYGVPGTTANSVAVIGSAGLTGGFIVSTDADGKLTPAIDAVFTKKHEIGPWDMTASQTDKIIYTSSLNLPVGYTILKIDLVIVGDSGFKMFNYIDPQFNACLGYVTLSDDNINIFNQPYYWDVARGGTNFDSISESRGYILVSYILY